ncbi:hypothetical protein RvY_03293 [Ramazzottius varieornatus]|uniref:C-type lectin domain-containing protein n=1 Tax=Ramazzottius varieornatus TaxID=947166 RepID=A0A1D1UMJ9_RAMVA|nr:hypothetical protein RvY_03293 [Ramazzottius varieornatus]
MFPGRIPRKSRANVTIPILPAICTMARRSSDPSVLLSLPFLLTGLYLLPKTELKTLPALSEAEFVLYPLKGSRDWLDAWLTCRRFKLQLAIILSVEENKLVEDLLFERNSQVSSEVPVMSGWLNLRRGIPFVEGEWDNGCSTTFTAFRGLDFHGDPGCAYIGPDGLWDIKRCVGEVDFAVCENRTGVCERFPVDKSGTCPDGFSHRCGQHCYWLSTEMDIDYGEFDNDNDARTNRTFPTSKLSFDLAEKQCRSLSGTLLQLLPEEELACLRSSLLAFLPAYTNDSLEVLYWTADNSSLNHTDGSPGEATNECSVRDQDGTAKKAPCQEVHNYVCQSQVLHRTVIEKDNAAEKRLKFIVAVSIVCLASLSFGCFLFINAYVCCKRHPSGYTPGARKRYPTISRNIDDTD